MFGICNLSIVPCRKEPADKSEIVTQLLFGDCFEITETKGNWIKIKIAYDGYVCWIDKKQFASITETFYKKHTKEIAVLANDLVHPIIDNETEQAIPIVIGSTLHDYEKNSCLLGKKSFTYDGHVTKLGGANSEKISKKRNGILEAAFLYLNAPYLWGGKTPFGIDCSGFTQMVFKLNGIPLFRDASQQVKQGTALNFIDEARAGDLAFFDNDKGKVIHVGIVLPDKKIIHASGKVRVDKLDYHGIFNEETQKYSHNLRVIRDVFENN